MNQWGLRACAVAVLVALLPLTTVGQEPKTAWGHPNLQGVWTSSTYTPLERPDSLADQAFLSEEELASLNELLTGEGVDPLRARSVLAADSEEERVERTRQTQENIHYDNSVWLREQQPRQLTTTRTSLIVDPPDGKIPALLSTAEEREAMRRQASRWLVYNNPSPSYDSHQTRTLQERCLVWRHEGPPMLPASYNDLLQIFQTEHYVVLMQEMRAQT